MLYEVITSLLVKSILITAIIALYGNNSFGQDIKKYDYAEVTVKIKGTTGEISEISLVSISNTEVKEKMSSTISKLKTTSALLKYMNSDNWELVDRTSQPLGVSIWVNYIFRKGTDSYNFV